MNILDAVMNLYKNPVFKLRDYAASHNRANNMGEVFEEYVQDLFADTVGISDLNERNIRINNTFSYLGNQNNPPDIILRGGDAIEVKKLESLTAQIALNSSYPKSALYSDSPMINAACRSCETWTKKDMIYAVGTIVNNNLRALSLIYGADYCADKSVYEYVKSIIKKTIESETNLVYSETNELGRVNKVDPLGITYLRVRGMWHIKNPLLVYDYIYTLKKDSRFSLMCIINDEKYYSFRNTSSLEALCKNNASLHIKNVKIKNPDNPAKLKDAKLITYEI